MFEEIKTERILLRKLRKSDWKMISYLRTDKEVNRWVQRPHADTKEKALEFITKTNTGIDDGLIYYWVLSNTKSDTMIGSICLWNFTDDRLNAEVGYDLDPLSQGRGLMDEAMKAVLHFAFNNLELDTIEAYTHKQNLTSTNLLLRNSFELVLDKKDSDNVYNLIYKRTK